MAKRPVFIVGERPAQAVQIRMLEFEWFPGLSVAQKRKSIASLHASVDRAGVGPALEVSRRSEVEAGRKLSAFNLCFFSSVAGQTVSVEAAFQGSKVFRDGGPYVDLLQVGPREAKKDPRLRDSGPLLGFQYGDQEWDLVPQTAFYDWLYVNAVSRNADLVETLSGFKAFTDIEFNPHKSKNCQAHPAALVAAGLRFGWMSQEPISKTDFLSLVAAYYESNAYSITATWGRD